MKKKGIIGILLCFLISFICTRGVFAATLMKKQVTLNLDTGEAKISGQLSGFKSRQKVTLLVYKPEMDADKLLKGEKNPDEVISKADEVKVDVNGNFTFDYYIGDGPTGWYTVNVNTEGAAFTQQFFGASPVEVQEAIATFNHVASDAVADTMFQVFNQHKYALGLPLELYDGMGEKSAYQLAVLKQLFQKKDYQLSADVIGEFKKATVLQAANKAANASDVQYLIDHYNDILGLDVAGTLYSSTLAEAEQKNAVLDNFAEGQYGSGSEGLELARKSFKKFVLLQAINDVTSYGQVHSLMSDPANNELLGNIDFTAYNNRLSSRGRQAVDIKIAEDTYTELEKIKPAFEAYVSGELGTGNGGGSGTGGGGSGHSKSGSGSSPIITAQQLPQDQIPSVGYTARYSDMQNAVWANEAVEALTDLKIVSGKGNGNFAPDDLIAREEFLKMLYLASGQQVSNEDCSFADVEKTAWYYPYIAGASGKGLIKGRADGTFGIAENITRQDMAVMVVRTMSYLGVELSEGKADNFADAAEIDDYAAVSVDAMHHAGFINGEGDNRFSPKKFLTRAEAAKVIYNLYRFINR